MPIPRLRALVHSVRLEYRARLARRAERKALARLGERLDLARLPDHCAPEARGAADRLCREIEALTQEIAATRVADHADCLVVSPWMRPVVLARGLAARQVLRHQRARRRRELQPSYVALGAVALGLAPAERARLGVAAQLDAAAHAARAGCEGCDADVGEGDLAPHGGSSLPRWAEWVRAEAGALGRALARQLRGQLFPKASALAGMAAGWWVANTYTDSHVRSVLRSVGIGRGGTHVVSGETYRAMSFWLPILAAASCAYLGDRLAAWARRRYDPAPEAPTTR